jgi:hypothetical protein
MVDITAAIVVNGCDVQHTVGLVNVLGEEGSSINLHSGKAQSTACLAYSHHAMSSK